MLAVVHFIYFLRILQKYSNILHPSRLIFFSAKGRLFIKISESTTPHLLLYSGLSQWKIIG